MPAYLLATVKSVKDRRGMEEYWSRAGVTFEGSGAKHLAAYTPFELLEGKAFPSHLDIRSRIIQIVAS